MSSAITYIDSDGRWYRTTKGAPEQVLNLCQQKNEIAQRDYAIIDRFAEKDLRSLAVAYQRSSNSPGGPWSFCGLLPLFDPPRHDSAETILRALNLGVCVKMITGDQFAIAKETGRRLGMGTNMYPSSSLLGHNNDEHDKQIISAVFTSRSIFHGMKNYTVYAVSITIRIVLGFTLLALIREYEFPPFMVLIIAVLNDGTIMTISKDRVRPSPTLDTYEEGQES